jgi:hypothetical protein
MTRNLGKTRIVLVGLALLASAGAAVAAPRVEVSAPSSKPGTGGAAKSALDRLSGGPAKQVKPFARNTMFQASLLRTQALYNTR